MNTKAKGSEALRSVRCLRLRFKKNGMIGIDSEITIAHADGWTRTAILLTNPGEAVTCKIRQVFIERSLVGHERAGCSGEADRMPWYTQH